MGGKRVQTCLFLQVKTYIGKVKIIVKISSIVLRLITVVQNNFTKEKVNKIVRKIRYGKQTPALKEKIYF